jgi:hypothetical protein
MIRYLIFFLLLACGNTHSASVIDGETDLIKYVELFKKEAERRGREFNWPSLTIEFGHTRTTESPNRIGYCVFSNPRLIVIDIGFYKSAKDYEKEALIFHELGHCVLNRPHLDKCELTFQDSCIFPSSLMSSVLHMTAYKLNKDYYLQELFSVAYSKYNPLIHLNCKE